MSKFTPGPWGCVDTSNHAHDCRQGRDCPAHTPGPWIAGVSMYFDVEVFSVVSPTNTGRLLAITGDTGKDDEAESMANARLIAAAPDLLEALAMVRDADDDCRRDGLPTIPQLARYKIDAAIAKATRESQ